MEMVRSVGTEVKPRRLTIPAPLAGEVQREARVRGWDADAFLARLIRSALDALKRMRVGIGTKGEKNP